MWYDVHRVQILQQQIPTCHGKNLFTQSDSHFLLFTSTYQTRNKKSEKKKLKQIIAFISAKRTLP